MTALVMIKTIDLRSVIIGILLIIAMFFVASLKIINYGAARTGVSVVEWQSDTASWVGSW